MNLIPSFQYTKLGDFTYHILSDPDEIRSHLMKWIMREWELDHQEAPHEHWTVEWMRVFPHMGFSLEVIPLEDICPHPGLMSVKQFQIELQERADEREWSMLRGVSIEPLLVDHDGMGLMDGYTRYTVLKRYSQKEVYAYIGKALSKNAGSSEK